MSNSPPRKVSGRKRRPIQRLNDYGCALGCLAALSASVEQKVTPPTTESQAADRAKKQAAIAAACGNTSRPAPLKHLKCNGHQDDDSNGEEDELKDNYDDKAGPSLLEYQFEDLDNQVDQVEWLYQSIEELGIRHNYCHDPEYQDEESLLTEWKQRKVASVPSQAPPPTTGNIPRIQTSLKYVLQPKTSGHSSRIQLHCTDNSTLSLDGAQVGSQDGAEHGFTPPANLLCTDSTTIGLDGKGVSPCCAGARSTTNPVQSTSKKRAHPGEAPASRPNQLSSAKCAHVNAIAPSQKKAVVLLSCIKALRKENTKATTTFIKPVIESTPKAPKPNPQHPLSPPNIEMQNPLGDEEDAPLQMAGGGAWPLSPPSNLKGNADPPLLRMRLGWEVPIHRRIYQSSKAGMKSLLSPRNLPNGSAPSSSLSPQKCANLRNGLP
ncbi:hypothetical protein RhiJN_27212 [Ceratobasidium sp. AG-Ba]|nr:hypothetical protein RhiJN_27212 [Ceratobasidium sp. AG-Ba]